MERKKKGKQKERKKLFKTKLVKKLYEKKDQNTFIFVTRSRIVIIIENVKIFKFSFAAAHQFMLGEFTSRDPTSIDVDN